VLYSKERQSKKDGSSYRTYNAKIQDAETGDVDEQWYQLGYELPKYKGKELEKGDYIQVDWEQNRDARKVVKGSLKISGKPPAKPDSPESEKPARNSGGGGNGGGSKRGWGSTRQSEIFGEVGGQYSDDDLIRILRGQALELATKRISVLLTDFGNGPSLKISAAAGAAGSALRYDQVNAAVDKLATKIFNDLLTGRFLEQNEDEGEVKEVKEDPLPDAKPATQDLDFDDDLPPLGDEDDDDFE